MQHQISAGSIDYIGLTINIALIPGVLLGFFYFGAQRIDGENNISYFILLIPIWLFILPLFAYIVLNGVAAQNTRIATCEKIILSLLVPLGFTITLLMFIWYYDNP